MTSDSNTPKRPLCPCTALEPCRYPDDCPRNGGGVSGRTYSPLEDWIAVVLSNVPVVLFLWLLGLYP